MEGWSYLCGTKGDLEADIIQGFLREQGIPAIKRYQGFAQVMKVYSGSGAVDIYVPSPDTEVAAQLLTGIDLDLTMEQKTEPAGEELSPAAGITADADNGSGAGSLWAIIIVVLLVIVLFLTLLFKQDFFFTK